MKNLLPIGRFSKICRLGVEALRHYDQLALLVPALVDPDTGYLYYSLAVHRLSRVLVHADEMGRRNGPTKWFAGGRGSLGAGLIGQQVRQRGVDE